MNEGTDESLLCSMDQAAIDGVSLGPDLTSIYPGIPEAHLKAIALYVDAAAEGLSKREAVKGLFAVCDSYLDGSITVREEQGEYRFYAP